MDLRVLSHEECVRRLGAGGVGRVATTHRALPAIMPVRYWLTDDALVFCAAGDPVLTHGCDGNVVAFEIDELAEDGRSGWSVMVVGTAHLQGDCVALEIGTISGRAVGAGLAVLA